MVGVCSAHSGEGGGDDDLEAQTAVYEECSEFVAALGLGFAVADAVVLDVAKGVRCLGVESTDRG